MGTTDGGNPLPRASERRWCPLEPVWQRVSHRLELFQIGMWAHPMARAVRWVTGGEHEPSFATYLQKLKSAQTSNLCAALNAAAPTVGVKFAATIGAAGLVGISIWLLSGADVNGPGRVIRTGANEAVSAPVINQGEMLVGPHSEVRVKDRRHLASIITGEVTFRVPLGSMGPFVVETRLARAVVPAEANFRVEVGVSVTVEVFEGVVLLYEHGARPGKGAITLRKGESYRVPGVVVAAEPRGRAATVEG